MKEGGKKKINRSFSSTISYLCLYNTIYNQCPSGTGLCLQKLMHMQVRNEVNSQLTYQHTCRAVHKFLLHLKPYHDPTFPCCRWHIQMNSSQILRKITQRCQPTTQVTYGFLQVAECSQPPKVQEAGGAWAHCTKVRFSHKTQTLREAWKCVREQAHGQLLHLMNFFSTFPTRDMSNDENAWQSHRHEQDALLRASLQGNGNPGTSLRWAATRCEDSKGQELHQPWTTKTHKTVVCSWGITNITKVNWNYLEWL